MRLQLARAQETNSGHLLVKTIVRTDYEELMKRLTAARKEAGVRQHQLAKKLGKGQSEVSKYERCERRLDIIEFLDIVSILDVDPADLIKDLPKPSKRNL